MLNYLMIFGMVLLFIFILFLPYFYIKIVLWIVKEIPEFGGLIIVSSILMPPLVLLLWGILLIQKVIDNAR